MVKEKRITLPADVYDTLELSALVFGGIGAYWLAEPKSFPFPPPSRGTPYCLLGHAGFASGADDYWKNPITEALAAAFGGANEAAMANNRAVSHINTLRGRDSDARVEWPDYITELNIVRGD